MEKFIDSNPGLRSRFNKYIHFDDYCDEDLLRIFMRRCKEQDYRVNISLKPLLLSRISQLRNEEGDSFGNARSVRNYFEQVISNQANRIVSEMGDDVSDGRRDTLMEITKEDL